MNEADIKEAFLAAMRASGVHMDCASNRGGHPIADGKIQRADSTGKGRRRKYDIWYILHADERPVGEFGDYKHDIRDTWIAGKDLKQLSDAEKAAYQQRFAEIRRERETYQAMLSANAAKAAALLLSGDCSTSVKPKGHPYLAKKGLPAFPGARVLTKDVRYVIDPEIGEQTVSAGTLIVPMFHTSEGNARLVSVQRIFANGDKRFLKGTPKKKAFHPVGLHTAPDAPIYIAEGYATAARIHEATGERAVAAFDAGNMTPVAIALKAKYPTARFIVMADNDRFTKGNPGVRHAREAAEAIVAPLVIPRFSREERAATDFDDLAQLRGLAAVRDAIEAELNPKPRSTPLLPPPSEKPLEFPVAEAVSFDFGGVAGGPVALGYDGEVYYYLTDAGQVIGLTANGHSKLALVGLAPLSWWEANFSGRQGCNWLAAASAMVADCKRRGVFRPDTVVGRGVILDNERVVAHVGDKLLIDGEPAPLEQPDAPWVYVRRAPLKLDGLLPLSNDEGVRFEKMMQRFSWYEPDMGRLLAGWLVIAPICGALPWRPHIWLTGERGSGKSYVMEQIAMRVLGGLSVQAQGGSTEPGIRRLLQCDLLPVLFDECEAKTESDKRRIEQLLGLSRQASSAEGAPIVKAASSGAASYRIRSPFLFASIDKNGTQPADESRTITIALRGVAPSASDSEKIAHAEAFAALDREVQALVTTDFGRRLFLRTVRLAKTIRQNAVAFATAIAKRTGSRRLGDTLGGPLAGWLSLSSDMVVTPELAAKCLEKWTWLGEAIERGQTEADHDAALSHLLQAHLGLDGARKRTVSEMVAAIIERQEVAEVERYAAHLERYGMRVDRKHPVRAAA
ncbi:hypothetical protein Rvan_1477 [Rhodomicrobium vannielii ATCC 17100]|uniref:Toprim domain-containing protein n=1 Tax=Rhodomicrobium vannielii (strain ATCC 17100 / DSM 162 / LMG 4299 / NCIMB 10020 / ATH 3.1.1) TaxID=648757 RepID=E3I781_RHOVT|nr:toprim domain-containing protein [Rhodomicrobium vannielii]ADP70732.1 hypothetical protein Rvan_1477 [Rhodomicrobium vannielii ATCC 17100]